MKFNFKFSNLLGTIYGKGNVCFTPDGNSIVSPVGNKITIYDLKNNKSQTLAFESRYNFTTIALSPNGMQLLAVNEQGACHLISMLSCTLIHEHKFHKAAQCVQFSPDGRHFAVASENSVFIFKSSGEITGEYNPFVLERHVQAAYDDITSLDWSSDSRFLAASSRDGTTKIISLGYFNNFRTYILGGHSDSIVQCFFEANSMDVSTISRNGQLCIWECSLQPSELTPKSSTTKRDEPASKRTKNDSDSESEDDIDNRDAIEQKEPDTTLVRATEDETGVDDKKTHPFHYKKLGRHYLGAEAKKESKDAHLTAATYHKRLKILVAAFSTGSFFLYELPDVNVIHSLSIAGHAITTACFNATGDWIALGSSAIGHLLVWEWQSEQYIMKQQGHSREMNCISYSPDGQYIATGGVDAKVKLWNINNGFCFVTFSEHSSSVTGVEFSRNKKFLLSCSLDGTVRAYDLIRYRNFRTFTSPRPVQFGCVALDYSGELVAAGGQDVFEIYLWSMKLGRLLEVLSGHEGPVSSIAFSPSPTSTIMVSGSWDKTLKIWNCVESSSDHETIDILSDVTCVAFNSNGEQVAVATLSGSILSFHLKTAQQISSIEGRNDLGSGVSEVDVTSARKNLEGKYFTSLAYSADGECLLAGGKSKNVCIYHVREGILLKKFEITENHSLDGLDDYINRRNITEFGNMALIEEREKLEGGNVAIRLPGVLKGDMASRNYKPEIRVFSLRFSPTGQSWAASTTEGLLIYSLDKGIVFDPFNLSLEVTPKYTRECLRKEEYSNALIMALKLNELSLIQEVMEKIPYAQINLISASLPNDYAHRLLKNVCKLLQSTPHVEFYLLWSQALLTDHGNKSNVFQHQSLLSLHEVLSRKYEMLNKICDFNKYTMRIIRSQTKKVKTSSEDTSGKDVDENLLSVSKDEEMDSSDDNVESSDSLNETDDE